MKLPVLALLVLLSIATHQPIALAQDAKEPKFQFPANFVGEECDAIVDALKNQKLNKDEFETSAAFADRVQSAMNSTVVAGRNLSEPRYFVNSDHTSAVYDADKGMLKVYGSLRQSTRVSEAVKYASTVIVKKRSAESSEYAAENRFGATTTVKRYRDEICGVAFLNVSPVTDHQWMGSIEFPLSAESARLSRGKISIVYLARLSPPLLVEHRQRIAATMSAPSEIVVSGDALTAILERFYVINKATGEVLFERVYSPR